MKKSIKALAVAGVVAGLGVAALPLSSYAVLSPNATGDDANNKTHVTAYVVDAIALNADAAIEIGDGKDTLVPGTSDSASFNVEVATNNPNGFTVTAKATDLTNDATTSHTIPSTIAAAAGTEGWYMSEGTNKFALNSTEQEVWTEAGTGSVLDVIKEFTVTVGTEDTTPTGTYEADITFRAAVAE